MSSLGNQLVKPINRNALLLPNMQMSVCSRVLIRRLRELGSRCKLIEAESDFGGTWYWNACPGSRVDSGIPVYEFSRPELWNGWT